MYDVYLLPGVWYPLRLSVERIPLLSCKYYILLHLARAYESHNVTFCYALARFGILGEAEKDIAYVRVGRQ